MMIGRSHHFFRTLKKSQNSRANETRGMNRSSVDDLKLPGHVSPARMVGVSPDPETAFRFATNQWIASEPSHNDTGGRHNGEINYTKNDRCCDLRDRQRHFHPPAFDGNKQGRDRQPCEEKEYANPPGCDRGPSAILPCQNGRQNQERRPDRDTKFAPSSGFRQSG